MTLCAWCYRRLERYGQQCPRCRTINLAEAIELADDGYRRFETALDRETARDARGGIRYVPSLLDSSTSPETT